MQPRLAVEQVEHLVRLPHRHDDVAVLMCPRNEHRTAEHGETPLAPVVPLGEEDPVRGERLDEGVLAQGRLCHSDTAAPAGSPSAACPAAA